MDNKALFNIGYGLYVLTARDGDKNNGCIINTVMQITDTPLAIVVGVNKQNLTHDMIMKTKEFNISVLTQNTPFDVFKHFGYQSGKTIDKFRDYKDKIEGENGIFYLSKYSNSYLYCKVMEVFEFGTHSLFKAEVIDAHLINNDETVTYTYYQTLEYDCLHNHILSHFLYLHNHDSVVQHTVQLHRGMIQVLP